jgi:hypothetical protein
MAKESVEEFLKRVLSKPDIAESSSAIAEPVSPGTRNGFWHKLEKANARTKITWYFLGALSSILLTSIFSDPGESTTADYFDRYYTRFSAAMAVVYDDAADLAKAGKFNDLQAARDFLAQNKAFAEEATLSSLLSDFRELAKPRLEDSKLDFESVKELNDSLDGESWSNSKAHDVFKDISKRFKNGLEK